jgi:hypothetical protein
MSERLPWSNAGAIGALVLVLLVYLAGFGLLVAGNGLGWLSLGLALWFTIGLVYTALRGGEDGA